MATPPDAHLREVLAETAESLVNRHLETAQEWHPHALIPWSRMQCPSSSSSTLSLFSRLKR